MTERMDPEAPTADAVEDATAAHHGYDDPTVSDSIEAPEWDAREQAHIVEFDDDYR